METIPTVLALWSLNQPLSDIAESSPLLRSRCCHPQHYSASLFDYFQSSPLPHLLVPQSHQSLGWLVGEVFYFIGCQCPYPYDNLQSRSYAR